MGSVCRRRIIAVKKEVERHGVTGDFLFDAPSVRRLVLLAIEEDLPAGDVTAALTIDPEDCGRATVVAREALIVCGVPLVGVVFREFGWEVAVEAVVAEGSRVTAEAPLVRLAGSTRHLLAAERIVLNFLQRLSGVATGVRRVVDAAHGITVLDTRKTTPGWRLLEKYAVRVGGGANHRGSLSDMVLVKNNHIAAHRGSVRDTLRRVFAAKPIYLPVEVEVRSLTELEEALEFDVAVIMLDNMPTALIAAALQRIRAVKSQLPVEVSGGITPERFPELARAGVTLVSMGALTTQAVNVDISMRLEGGVR